MQDYKSLCAAVLICATLVNIQTDRHTDSTVTRAYHMISSAAYDKGSNELVNSCENQTGSPHVIKLSQLLYNVC